MKKAQIKSDKDWQNEWYDTESTGGRFERHDSLFRNWITADGEPGPSGIGGFNAEANRYHLFISLACPWAHRTLITRKLKQLDGLITVSNSNSYMGPDSWTFEPEAGRIFPAKGITMNILNTCLNSTAWLTRTTMTAPRCRSCGTKNARPSSAMNRRKSCACSTARSMT